MSSRQTIGAVAIVMFASALTPVMANHLTVSNVTLVAQDLAARTVDVKLDLRWDNSWRNSENWDAAWVFVKFRAPGSNVWEHALLSTTEGDHRPCTNSVIATVPDGRGVFVYRSAAYTGNVAYTSTRLRWTYGSNNYTFAEGAALDLAVQAVEMVYIPQGAFFLGGTGTEVAHFYQHDGTAQTTQRFAVVSEAAISVGTSAGNLYYTATGGNYGDGVGPIPAAFPKGYAAFYCMKYELTQGQYVDLLNKLTPAQEAARYANTNGFSRNTIGGSVTNRSTTAPDRACNFISWADGIAYAAWAGLRPMTELEYEKACRGPEVPVAEELAWGSASTTALVSESGVSGSGTETASPATANFCDASTFNGPTRVGIFATASTTNRLASGASYYGVMDLSGNLIERPVTVGNATGRAFAGTHGAGVLNAAGNPTNADWPSDAGGGMRGMFWASAALCSRVADRYSAARSDGTVRYKESGWRGVRTAP